MNPSLEDKKLYIEFLMCNKSLHRFCPEIKPFSKLPVTIDGENIGIFDEGMGYLYGNYLISSVSDAKSCLTDREIINIEKLYSDSVGQIFIYKTNVNTHSKIGPITGDVFISVIRNESKLFIPAKCISQRDERFFTDLNSDKGSIIFNSSGAACGILIGDNEAISLKTAKWMIKNSQDYPTRGISFQINKCSLESLVHLGKSIRNYKFHNLVSESKNDTIKNGDIIHSKDRLEDLLWISPNDKVTVDITRDGVLMKNIEFYF